MSLNATFAGKALLGSNDVSWTLKDGVHPVTKTFDMMPQDVEELLAGGAGPYSLTLPNDTIIQNLYLIHNWPGDHPKIRRVTVADRRYWWKYKWIRRYYNIRRNVGVSRLTSPNSPLELQGVASSVWYHAWSLRDPKNANPVSQKWEAFQALTDIFKAVMSVEKGHFGVGQDTLIDAGAFLQDVDVEDLFVNARGDQAIEQIIGYMPELGISVANDGTVYTYSKVSGAETEAIGILESEMVGGGHLERVDNALVRPSHIEVLFQYEPELRLDFDEAATSDVTNDTLYVENVLPIPDFSLTVNGKTLCQGTYITIDEALAAWPAPPGWSTNLTQRDLQKASVPFVDLFTRIGVAGAFDPNANWAARIGVLQQHYRRTFRAQRYINDMVQKWLPYRSATIKPDTGSRAPAVCYTDYCYIHTLRSLFNETYQGATSSRDYSYAINVKGHPALPSEAASKALDESVFPAPCHVRIVDADQGIIHLDYEVDPNRVWEIILPSMMTLEAEENNIDANGKPLKPGPTSNILNRTRPISFDAIGRAHINNLPKLTSNHKASIILTAIPASPNSEAVFFRIKIEAGDSKLLATLPPAARSGISNAKGPPLQIHVGPGIETARVAWVDNGSDKVIRRALGLAGNVSDVSDEIAKWVTNYSDNATGAASLNAIAYATAARIYATFADRLQGEMHGTMNPNVVPTGWLSEVTHTLAPNGVPTTHAMLPAQIQPMDIFPYLDSSTRAIILKTADPSRVA